jgi:uncharacterized membrane protein YfcA
VNLALLLVAAFVAGAINEVAGGGSLLTFPALLAAGLTPLGATGLFSVSDPLRRLVGAGPGSAS